MPKPTKEDIIEKILTLGINDEFENHILTQEFIVANLRLINDPSEDDMVETQNNVQLLEHMKSEDYKNEFIQVFREEYSNLDMKSLEFIVQAMEVTTKIRDVEKKSHARIEEKINSLDFLLEVENKEETSASKVLH